MPQLRLVLVDKDQYFIERFSDYIQRNKSDSFELQLFTSSTTFEKWVADGGKADIIAVSSSTYDQLSSIPGELNMVVLSDGPQSLVPKGFKSIKKYQAADSLTKELLSACADCLPSLSPTGGKSGNVHVVLYADGSDLMNPVAPSIAMLFALNNKKTFYMGLEQIPSIDSYFQSTNDKGLSEMLYFVKSRKDGLALKAEVCTSTDLNLGVQFMKAHRNPEDIAGLTKEDIKTLIESIQLREIYEEIIISREFRFDDVMKVLLEEASQLYIVGFDYPSSNSRLSAAAEILTAYQTKNHINITDKCLFLIASENGEQMSLNSHDIQKKFLPYNTGTFFPPSNEYADALAAALTK